MAKKAKKSRFAGKIKKSIEKKAASRGNFGYLQLPKGVSLFKEEADKRIQFDIIPYIVSDKNHPDRESGAEKGEQWFCRPFKVHRNIGANSDTVVCPTTFGKKCPICEYRAKLLKKGNADKKELDALRPSSRVLYNIIPKGNKKIEEKVHIWDISNYCFQELLDTEVAEKEKYEAFPDLECGFTLDVRFSPETVGKSKPFGKANRIDFETRDKQYDESILDEVADLDKVLNLKSYEELEKMFLEMDDSDMADDDDDIEDDDTPKKKKSSKKKPVEDEDDEDDDEEDEEDEDDDEDDEDEDEDDEDDDDEDDEDEDEDDEDDEDEDDEDDEDEEPAPKKGKGKKPAPKSSKSPIKKRKR